MSQANEPVPVGTGEPIRTTCKQALFDAEMTLAILDQELDEVIQTIPPEQAVLRDYLKSLIVIINRHRPMTGNDPELETATALLTEAVKRSGYSDNAGMPPICVYCGSQRRQGVMEHKADCLTIRVNDWLERNKLDNE